RLDITTCGLVSRRLARFGREPTPSPAGRLIAGVMANDAAFAGDPAEEVVQLARRMLQGGSLPSDRIGAQIPMFAANALGLCDQFELARRLLDEMIGAARAAGKVRALMVGLCWRGQA